MHIKEAMMTASASSEKSAPVQDDRILLQTRLF
jgi:hypothetical protein